MSDSLLREILATFDPVTRRLIQAAVEQGVEVLDAIRIFYENFPAFHDVHRDPDVAAERIKAIRNKRSAAKHDAESDKPDDTMLEPSGK